MNAEPNQQKPLPFAPLVCVCLTALALKMMSPIHGVCGKIFLPFKQGTSCIGMGFWVVCSCGIPDLVVQLHNHQHNCRCIVL